MFKSNIFLILLVLYVKNSHISADGAGLTASYADPTTLLYVTGVFRHGDRTVDAGTEYPTDPYINETYYPYGIGQLTSKGKKRIYKLGKELRKRYDVFLDDIYQPEVLDAVSTNSNRTKASLALLLAGLYPPIGNIMQWDATLNWQPIPFDHVNFQTDLWFSIPTYFCPNYAKGYLDYLSTPEGKAIQDKHRELFEYVSDNSGLNVSIPMDIFHIYSCFKSQVEWGLTLPDWADKVWPDTLNEATKDGLASSIATSTLKQLSGGFLVQRIIGMLKEKADGTMYPEERKLSLLSGHDLNIVYLLGAMNVFTPHVVPYGACVLIELHRISGQHYVKVIYEDYSAHQPRTLIVPGCEELCPLDKFEQVLKVNFPVGDDPCGTDTSIFRPFKRQRKYYLGQIRYKKLQQEYIKFNEVVRPLNHHAVINNEIGEIKKLEE